MDEILAIVRSKEQAPTQTCDTPDWVQENVRAFYTLNTAELAKAAAEAAAKGHFQILKGLEELYGGEFSWSIQRACLSVATPEIAAYLMEGSAVASRLRYLRYAATYSSAEVVEAFLSTATDFEVTQMAGQNISNGRSGSGRIDHLLSDKLSQFDAKRWEAVWKQTEQECGFTEDLWRTYLRYTTVYSDQLLQLFAAKPKQLLDLGEQMQRRGQSPMQLKMIRELLVDRSLDFDQHWTAVRLLRSAVQVGCTEATHYTESSRALRTAMSVELLFVILESKKARSSLQEDIYALLADSSWIKNFSRGHNVRFGRARVTPMLRLLRTLAVSGFNDDARQIAEVATGNSSQPSDPCVEIAAECFTAEIIENGMKLQAAVHREVSLEEAQRFREDRVWQFAYETNTLTAEVLEQSREERERPSQPYL